MRRKSLRVLGGVAVLFLACTLVAPSRAEARGPGWGWALPLGVAMVTIAGLSYYTHSGVYYRPAPYGGYVVVPPPVTVVQSAPAPVVVATPGALPVSVTVASPSLNIRSGPGYEYAVVLVVAQGSTLPVVGGSGGWLSVRTPSGGAGWVAQQFTRPNWAISSNG